MSLESSQYIEKASQLHNQETTETKRLENLSNKVSELGNALKEKQRSLSQAQARLQAAMDRIQSDPNCKEDISGMQAKVASLKAEIQELEQELVLTSQEMREQSDVVKRIFEEKENLAEEIQDKQTSVLKSQQRASSIGGSYQAQGAALAAQLGNINQNLAAALAALNGRGSGGGGHGSMAGGSGAVSSHSVSGFGRTSAKSQPFRSSAASQDLKLPDFDKAFGSARAEGIQSSANHLMHMLESLPDMNASKKNMLRAKLAEQLKIDLLELNVAADSHSGAQPGSSGKKRELSEQERQSALNRMHMGIRQHMIDRQFELQSMGVTDINMQLALLNHEYLAELAQAYATIYGESHPRTQARFADMKNNAMRLYLDPIGQEVGADSVPQQKKHIEYVPYKYLNDKGQLVSSGYDLPIHYDSLEYERIDCNSALSFETDCESAEQWAGKSYKQWRSGLSKEEEDSIRKYAGSKYSDLNSLNRGDIAKYKGQLGELRYDIQNIQNALSRAKCPQDVVVYRAISQEAMADIAIKAGGELKSGIGLFDMSFISTSLVCKNGFTKDLSNRCILRLIVPSGYQCAPLQYGDLAVYDTEYEMLGMKSNYVYISRVRKCRRSDVVPGSTNDMITLIDGILTI